MFHRCCLISIFIFLFVYAPPHKVPGKPVAADPHVALQLQLRNHLGGRAEAVFVQGNYAYAGFGFEFAIVDLSLPATPTRLGFVLLPDIVTDVSVVDHYAFVTCSTAGLWVVDIANGAAPTSIGAVSLPGVSAHVVVAKNYAYVVADDAAGGLSIVDISRPHNPFLVAHYDHGSGGLVVVANLVYLTDWFAGLLILDVTHPLSIKLLGTYDPPGVPFDVAVNNQYAYLATSSGLRVVDISNPATPTEIAANVTSPAPSDRRVEIVDDHAYITKFSGDLRIVDVTDPTHPTQVSLLATTDDQSGAGGGLAVIGSYAYVSDSSSGIYIINVANVLAPVIVGVAAYAQPANPRKAVVYNSYLYTSGHVINVGNPDQLAVVGTFPGDIELIAAGYGYGRSDSGTLQILSLANPASPSVMSVYATEGGAGAMSINYPYAYISDLGHCGRGGCDGGGLHIVDISNPTAPKRVGWYNQIVPVSLAATAHYLYAVSQGNLHIFDLTDPVAPIEVGLYRPPASEYSTYLSLSGHYAYVATQAGLHIVDISAPTRPIERGVVGILAWQVVVAEPYAYVVFDGMVQIVDITDVSHPTIVTTYTSPGAAKGVECSVALGNDTIYLAAHGLFALRLVQVELTHQEYLPITRL